MTGVISSSSTEFTASDGRRFAFPVGTAFLLLAGILWWRDHATPMWITATLGVLLYAGGLAAPARLGPVYRAWMKLALLISKVTTPIFMGIVYFGVLMPTGLFMRIIGRKVLDPPPQGGGYWKVLPAEHRSDLRRQF